MSDRARHEKTSDLPEVLRQLEDKQKVKERLLIRSSGRIVLLTCSDISWISSAGNYAEIHVGKTVHLLRQTLSALEQKLPEYFARISKSHLVNIRFIREWQVKSHGDSLVTLVDGTELIATRSYRAQFRKRLNS